MVAATRSQVCTVFGASAQGKTGTAAASIIKGSGDTLISTEVLPNVVNYTCLNDKNANPEDCSIKPKADRRRRKRNPGYRPSRRRYALPDDDFDIVASPARPDNLKMLEAKNIQGFGESRRVSTPALNRSTNRSTESITSQAPKLKFGMYAGRVKANPLKYLATVLRSKLQPHNESCNLLQIATEIHNEAKNKHNTTLRRIYDVVNVLEATGLLERNNGHASKESPVSQRLENECSASISRFVKGNSSSESWLKSGTESGVVVMECDEEKVDTGFRSQTVLKAAKPNPLQKKGTRGSMIRWLGSEAEHKKRFHRERDRETLYLDEERIAAAERISKKQLEFESLKEELRLTTALIKHNQNVTYDSDSFEKNMNPCTPPPEDFSYSYLNFEDSSPSSVEAECKPESIEWGPVIAAAACGQSNMCGSSSSSMSREFDPRLNNPSQTTEDFWYNRTERDFEMNVLEAARQYLSSGLPLTTSAIAKKALNVPFVILQTSNATNVHIELDGDGTSARTSEVFVAMDNEYKLFDYRELLSSMFPMPT